MKNTKNLILISLTLVIALLTSVQITAMEQKRKVNPCLSKKQKHMVGNRLSFFIEQNESCDPKNRLVDDPKYCPAVTKKISQLEAIYYDDKSYPDTEIENIVYEFSLD